MQKEDGECPLSVYTCATWKNSVHIIVDKIVPFSLSLSLSHLFPPVAFRIYDIDQDGFISNGELFQVLKTMVGNNLTEKQLQEIVDKTILYADKDGDGKISFQEFCDVRNS